MSQLSDETQADLLIREVDDDLRQDQMQQLWKRYSSLFLSGAVAIVLGVAGWQAYGTWTTKQRQAASQIYAQAQSLGEQGKAAEAADALARLGLDGTEGYRLLSLLKQAEMKIAANDRDGALALYEKIAASGADKAYADLATIKAAYLKLDKGLHADAIRLVERLAQESSPWRHSAREIMALAALKANDLAKAGELLRKIADDGAAPQGLRARATELLAATSLKSKG